MSNPYVPTEPRPEYRPRLWPGVLLLLVVFAMLFVPPLVHSIERTFTLFMLMMAAPLIGLAGGAAWWFGYSRVPVLDRVAIPLLVLLPLIGFGVETVVVDHQPPMGPVLFGVPFVLLLFVGWLVVSLPLPGGARRAGAFAAVVLGWGLFGLVRLEQTDADMRPMFAWRWEPRPENRERTRERVDAPADPVEVTAGDWAEFRGPNRDDTITGVALDTDAFGAAKLVWKKEMYPGWGSFAVVGHRLYTMEQQGDREVVLCLDANTGKQVGEAFSYPSRFFDSNAGVGPRSTPTVSGGKVYALGANGVLHCLTAADLKPVWSVHLVKDAGGVRPMWGFASSPLVVHGLVIVYTGGPDGKGTTAFGAADGKVKWQAGQGTHGYSSAQLVTFAGVEQVLMQSNHGVESFDPTTGAVLWEHAWDMKGGNRTCQIPILGDGELLLGSGVGVLGTRRLKVTKAGDRWDVQVVWESKVPSPYFNDGVVYRNHYYGFSGSEFHCIDLANGKEKWTDGTRYGNGQVLLFADQGLLVVTEAKNTLTEVGKVYLLKADPDPDADRELASFDGIKGKTWNHASFARGRLYLRNGVEAACYELPLKK